MKRTWIMAFFIGTALLAASCGQDTAESGETGKNTVQSESKAEESNDSKGAGSGTGSAAAPDQTESAGALAGSDSANTPGSGSTATGSTATRTTGSPWKFAATLTHYCAIRSNLSATLTRSMRNRA